MGCINNNTYQGGCTMFDADDPENENVGCDKEGHCLCENDEAPMDSCTYYESDGSDDEEGEYDDGFEDTEDEE